MTTTTTTTTQPANGMGINTAPPGAGAATPGALAAAPLQGSVSVGWQWGSGTSVTNTSRQPYTEEDARSPRNWGPEAIKDLQEDLVASGFISEDEAKQLIPGRFDPLTYARFTELLSHSNTLGKTWEVVVKTFSDNPDMKTVLDEQKVTVTEPRVGGANVYTTELSDPATIRSIADKVGQNVLGRKLKKSEMDKIVSEITRAESAQQEKVQSASESSKRALFDTAADAALGKVAAEAGVGPIDDSTGPGIADAMAKQYGLTKTNDIRDADRNARVGGAKNSDHLPGGNFAADFAGSQDKMAAFAAFARENQGEGKLFAKVFYGDKGHKDNVHVTYNTQAGPAATGDGGVDQFMEVIAGTESGGNYDAVNTGTRANPGKGTGAHGKFQIMPGNWGPWAAEAGLGANAPKTPENQDKVARFKMQQYYDQFGSWDAVAVAWFAGPARAEKYVKGDRSVLGISDGNMTVGEYVERAKAGMAKAIPGVIQSPNTYLPSTTVATTNVDTQARTEEMLRAANPVEAGAHDIAANVYGSFLSIVGAR